MNTKNAFSTLLTVLITAVAVGVLTGVITYSYAASKKDLEIGDLKEQLSQVKEEGVDETANWKTYTNDKYGFSFKYPENLLLTDDADLVKSSLQISIRNSEYNNANCIKENSCDSGFMILFQSSGTNINDTLKSQVLLKDHNSDTIVIGGVEGIIYKPVRVMNSFHQSVFVQNNHLNGDETFIITLSTSDNSSEKAIYQFESIFDQILSTFQFTSSSGSVKSNEKKLIDQWLEDNKDTLNKYGDHIKTIYAGGTPLFNEVTGKTIDAYEYIMSKHPDKPWNR